MCSGVPNLAFAVGYTNASWTLKADLTAQYVCRLLAYMDRAGYSYSSGLHSSRHSMIGRSPSNRIGSHT